MRNPRTLDQLPFAEHLTAWDGALAPGRYLDGVHLHSCSIEDARAAGTRLVESALDTVELTGGSFAGARFADVWQHAVRWTGVDLTGTGWLDVELVTGALVGLPMYDADLRRVRMFGCKLDTVNLRGARLRDVDFVDCELRGVDLAGASLSRVRLAGGTVTGLRLAGARLADVDLRGARTLDVADGAQSLAGATISTAQLVALAPELARAVGIDVRDD